MYDILIVGAVLALSIWFFKHNKKVLKKHVALAEDAVSKGIDLILSDGRRVVDDSVECTIPHRFVRHAMTLSGSAPPYFYLGQGDVTAFHKLKDGTWLRQDALWAGVKGLRNRSYTQVEEVEVRKALASYPDQFTKAFGEPVVV